MSSDKMKDRNEGSNKQLDPGSALGYKLMIYMILRSGLGPSPRPPQGLPEGSGGS